MDATEPLTRFATPEDLVQKLKTLPAAPKVILKLQKMAGNSGTCVEDLVALIKVERALAARIVKVANSPIFNLGSPCNSIEESVQRVGFIEVQRLALLVAGCETLNHPLPAYGVESPALWHQTVTCAVAAEYLAGRCGEDQSTAYTAGLMQNVGMVVINAWMQSIAPGKKLSYQNSTFEWSSAERHELGYDQADAGGALLKAWGFPAPVVEAVRNQYTPTAIVGPHARQVAILFAARWLRSTIGNASPDIIPPMDPEILQILGLSEAQLLEGVPVVIQKLDTARAVIGNL